MAETMGVVSTILVLKVGAGRARAFDQAWAALDADPPAFWLAGANCSTRASRAFREAAILSCGIPGLDSPDNLYRQLRKACPTRSESHSGFIGFSPTNAGHAVTVG